MSDPAPISWEQRRIEEMEEALKHVRDDIDQMSIDVKLLKSVVEMKIKLLNSLIAKEFKK